MAASPKKLGELLIEKGLISPSQLDAALLEQTRTKEFLGLTLIRRGALKEQDLAKALSEQFKLPIITLKDKFLDWDFLKDFDSELIIEHKCFPVSRTDYSLTVAITNPLDVWAIEKAERQAPPGSKVKLVLTSIGDMADAIARYKEYMRKHISDILP
ncbi:MAG TPA: hypothetical protein PKL77_06650 [Candidatus Omnitrophota bacterium]|nr:hypothetical protein [Candidatus Omnitrophota bacterium]HPT07944.1 hypothetical protein [Candidatus Omnitrophota bacterium]